MAEKDDGYRLISVEDDDSDDEVVFHAGVRSTADSAQSATSAAGSPIAPDAGATNPEPAASVSAPSGQAVSTDAENAAQTQERADAEPADERQAPKTAKERQAARKQAERRQRAAEIAATEDDLKSAGKMSKAQIATIVICIVLLIIGIVYVVNTFLS